MATYTIRNNAFFRQLIFLAILIITGIVIAKQLAFFVGSFLGAITIYIVLRNVLFTLVEKYKWKSWAASITLVSATAVLLLALGYLVFRIIASELPAVDTSHILGELEVLPSKVNAWLDMDLIPDDILKQSGTLLSKAVSTALNTTYSFAINVFLTLVILYFMLAHSRRMECRIEGYIPFKEDSLAILKTEFKSMVFSNAVGIPMVMISQGIVACIIYWAFGLPNFVFWAFITALCGLIPMVGTAIVSVPLGIYYIANDQIIAGIALMLCGLLLIANVDNLVRIVMMKKITNTHPLIVIFGVIMGIPFFGFWGIIFGPLLISGFLLLIRIYYKEYSLLSKSAERCDKIESASHYAVRNPGKK